MNRGKREKRRAYVEYIGEGGGVFVLFVFRGAWIDAIVMKRGVIDFGGLIDWLKETGYFEEVAGIALGDGLKGVVGGSSFSGIPVVEVPPRNLRDAKVIIDGIREWLSQDSSLKTDRLKSQTKV